MYANKIILMLKKKEKQSVLTMGYGSLFLYLLLNFYLKLCPSFANVSRETFIQP